MVLLNWPCEEKDQVGDGRKGRASPVGSACRPAQVSEAVGGKRGHRLELVADGKLGICRMDGVDVEVVMGVMRRTS